MQGVKHCRPQQAYELVLAWISETGLKGQPMPPHESDAVAGRRREREGVKNAALSHNPKPTRTPCLGLQKQDRLPQRTLPFCQPPRAPPDSSGISG